jgi:hypothetical protein
MIDLLSNSVPLDESAQEVSAIDGLEKLLAGYAVINLSGKIALQATQRTANSCDWWCANHRGVWQCWYRYTVTEKDIRDWWYREKYDLDVWLLAEMPMDQQKPTRAV